MMFTLLLLAAASGAVETAPAAPDDPLDKVRCVREVPAGSLIATQKTCHTVREWNRISRDGQAEARRMAQPGTLNDLNK